MTLRTRLFLTSLVIAVPLAVALFVINERMRLGAMEEELRASVDFDLSSGLRERCEMDPPRAGRPGRGNGPPAPAPPPPRGFGPPDGPPRDGPPRGGRGADVGLLGGAALEASSL